MIDNTDINGEFLTWVYLTVKDAPDPILWFDESGRLLRANAAACRRFGFPSNNPAGLTIHDIDTRCDAARWSMLKDDWVKQPGNIYETQFFSRQGEPIPVEVTCAHFPFNGRRLFSLFARDISLCQRIQAVSKESEARLRAILMALPDLVFVLTEEGRYLEVLTSREELLSAPINDLQGRLLQDIFEKPEADRFLKLTQDTLSSNAPVVIEYELPIGGQIHTFEARAAPMAEAIDGKRCIVLIVRDITERKRAEHLHSQNLYLREELTKELNYGDIVGSSAAMRTVFENIKVVAGTDATVLLLGETGTGKELIARAVHKTGSRRSSPLIKVNCGALPTDLAESELFGHEKGAFTGATDQKKGRFELAHHGTIFLDEVGELPAAIQIKLLRVLQEQEFERVGGTQTLKVNVRVIAATNHDLLTLVKEGNFRSDLYYRLNIFPIKVPPLRDRREDIPLLTKHFTAAFAKRFGRHIDRIDGQAMEKLMRSNWPGNVRELANVIERAVILCPGGVLEKKHISDLSQEPIKGDRFPTLEEVERQHIQAALGKTGGILAGSRGAASLLNINRSTLWSRMQKLGIRIDKKYVIS
ncbi:sigma 54-interacting transcriptional regulator [Desulfosarcina sp.]|uniref:sigma-54 interaction domain-containing protein n=1 Tax=Desulfosarcina sp. TaxID=2027861 RepID=UPI003970ECB4